MKYWNKHRIFKKLTIYIAEVIATDKDALEGTESVLSCKITGLSAKATVIWTKGDQTQGGTTEGELNDGTQISTLTVTNPQEDTEYTCVVTSGEYSSSEPSETPLSLNVYGKFLLFSQTMKVVNYSELR